jgi:hypothetical protein
MMGENFESKVEFTIGVKNGISKFLSKNLPFIKWFAEGFLL